MGFSTVTTHIIAKVLSLAWLVHVNVFGCGASGVQWTLFSIAAEELSSLLYDGSRMSAP